MSAPVFIGDELTAAGFRLAGMRVISPPKERLESAFKQSCSDASLIMITQEYLSMLDTQTQEECLLSVSPAVVVIPDIRNQHPPSDISIQLRKKMGMIE